VAPSQTLAMGLRFSKATGLGTVEKQRSFGRPKRWHSLLVIALKSGSVYVAFHRVAQITTLV
jgi:hypothetical protein